MSSLGIKDINEAMKITMLSNFGRPIRGVSPYSDDLVQALCQFNVKVDLCDYIAAYPLILAPNQIQNFNSDSKRNISYLNPVSWFRFAKLAENIVHIQYWTQFSAYYLYLIVRRAKFLGKRVIITVHNPHPHENVLIFNYFEVKLLTTCDNIIVHTSEGMKILRSRLGVKCPTIKVIHHGVKLNKQIEVDDKNCTNVNQKTQYILVFGNIRKYKGTDLIIDAWKTISALHKDTKLIIAGSLWGDSTTLMQRIGGFFLGTNSFSKKIRNKLIESSKYQIEANLKFIGENELNSLVKNAHLAIFPYRQFSGQSGAIAKAIGFGTPIICSNLEGLKENAVNDSFIVPKLTIDNLAITISNCLNSINDSTRTEQWNKAKNFDWKSSATKHIELYQAPI